MERFYFKKLKRVKSNFVLRSQIADLDTEMEINRAREIISENIKISVKESLGSIYSYIETSVRNKCRCSFYCALLTLHVSAPIGGHLQVVL
jgi:hypothetical protein